MTLTELRQQKTEMIGWYKFTKDKKMRQEIRHIDKLIKKELVDNATK